MNGMDALDVVMQYHRETKHHPNRYARSLGYLDWANQPNPFRRFDGAELVPLPILGSEDEPLSPPYEDLYLPLGVPVVPVSIRALSRLFEYALALSAWKQDGGARWALRSNPSSGNLHPTEGYLLIGGVPGSALTGGLYHYAPKEHALERRTEIPAELFASLMKDLPPRAFLVGLSSVHWREAWKYGERAYRYCQHDAGHAIATIRIAAATLGWSAAVLEDVADPTIEELLGLDRARDFEGAERENPALVMAIWPAEAGGAGSAGARRSLPLYLHPDVVHELSRQRWHGKANRLSAEDPVPWEIIERVAEATRKSSGESTILELAEPANARRVAGKSSGGTSGDGPSAGQIIRQRRSLLGCDGKTGLPAEAFYRILSRVMPRVEDDVSRRPMPWDGIPRDPTIHLALFVHRISGIPAGLYYLPRDPDKKEALRSAMRGEFSWSTPPGCPPDLPLYLLKEMDARDIATRVSCHQEIAGDGAFALGMIAEFEPVLRNRGPWFYRRLFWETGVIGQVLYLEAEAAGVRGTGIGCFFDDSVHQVFGFTDLAFQSLYHFTVGGPVDDPRLTTLPPYGAHISDLNGAAGALQGQGPAASLGEMGFVRNRANFNRQPLRPAPPARARC
jgi:SagB-type dehydrogenase family enzyme